MELCSPVRMVPVLLTLQSLRVDLQNPTEDRGSVLFQVVLGCIVTEVYSTVASLCVSLLSRHTLRKREPRGEEFPGDVLLLQQAFAS